MEQERWYYLESDVPTGPFPWPRLLALSKAGIVGPTTLVCIAGGPEWVTLAEASRQRQPERAFPPSVPISAGGESLSAPAVQNSSAIVSPFELVGEPLAQTTLQDRSEWLTTPAAPWRRYGARMVDTTVHGYLGAMVIAFAWYAVAPLSAEAFFTSLSQPPTGPLLDIVLTVSIAALVGGLVVGVSGSSLGKAIFGIKVVDRNMHAIGIRRGLNREMHVWFRGMALGIPIVAIFTMLAAFNTLQKEGVSSWDRDKHVVLYRPNGRFQYLMNAVGIALFIILFTLVRGLNAAL